MTPGCKDSSPGKIRGPDVSPFKNSPRMSPRKWMADGKLEARADGKGSEVLQSLRRSNSNRTLDLQSPKRKRPATDAFSPALSTRKSSSALGSTGNCPEEMVASEGSVFTKMPTPFEKSALVDKLGRTGKVRMSETLGQSGKMGLSETVGQSGKMGLSETVGQSGKMGLSETVGQSGKMGLSDTLGQSGKGRSPERPRFARPPLAGPSRPSHVRSATSVAQSPPKPVKLRRATSLLSSSETSLSDRFIPSHRNSTPGKLTASAAAPHPNASPRSHIKAQTSKIYQHHVAEACGLDVNSRILSYRPLPPERSKPLDLFSHLGSSISRPGSSARSLRPSLAYERANKIPSAPDRVLDAPNIIDDFYLNLIAWSSTNLIVIGLEDAVYVWNATSGSVGLLCETPGCLVTSLRWSDDGSYISIGKDDGTIEIWDIETNARLRTLSTGTSGRIAAHAWSAHMLTAGSKEGVLSHSDVRVSQHLVARSDKTHVAEVCGVEFRQDGLQFCSGGNDNVVAIWDARNLGGDALFTKNTHRAAVKAISWCPYQPSLLATGGGTSDKTIHFWNTSTGARVHSIETESQISSLNWGYAKGTGYEMVATHGYPSNSISLFNYPTLQKTGEIVHAHDSRILNGCISPDGMTLATVSGDENLKFWSLFDYYKAPVVDDKEGKQMQKLMNIR